MAFKETLQLVIQGDNRGAVKAVREVGQVSTTEFNKSQKRIDQWGKGLTKAGVGMAAFGAAALVGLGSLAKQSEEANLAQVKLDNTLTNMPKLAGENSKQFTDLATKIQSVTAADADAIIEGEALLGTFNLTAQQIKGITPLVVDYARKFGVDIPTAAIQVGKALDGQVGALKRNGVSIDEVMFKTDRYGAVQKALQDQVGGFAKAEGATFAGSLERMKNQLGDLAEGVGGGAVDAFTKMFGAVGKAAGALDRISPGAQNAAGQVATFAAVGLVAVGGLSTLVGKAIEARQNFGKLAGGLSDLNSKMGGLGRVASVAAGAIGIGALVLEARHLNDEANKLDVDKVTQQLNSVGEAGQKAARRAVEVSLAFNHQERDVRQLAEASVPAARQYVELAKAIGAPETMIRKLNKIIEEKKQADIGGAQAQDAYTQEVDKATGALGNEADSATAAADAIKQKADEERAAIDPLFAMQDALQGNVEAQGDVTAKRLEAVAAENAYLAAVKKFGPTSKEAQAASLELASARGALTDADRKAVRSAEDVDQATADLRAEIEKNPAALDTAKAKLRQWQAQGLITAGQARKTAREFDGLAGAINRTPRAKTIRVRQVGAEGAKIKILQVVDAMGRLHNKTLTIGVTTALGAQAVGLMESKMFRAAGGPVRANKAYVVGESGPELFLPDTGGMIIPNKQMAAGAMGGWGGGGKVQVDINVAGDGLMRYIRNQVRIQHGGDVQAALGSKR